MIDYPELIERYQAALQQAVASGVDPTEAGAAELGQTAIDAGLSLSSLLLAHHTVVAQALLSERAAGVAERAAAFLCAFLAPLERLQAQLRIDLAGLAEEKRALEQLPEVLLEGIPAMVYVAPWHGRPGEMLYVSPQSEAVLGYSALDWIANPNLWLDQLDPEDLDRAVGERVVGQAEGDAYVSEYRLRDRNGRAVWIHDEARGIRSPDGQPQFWQGVMLDITQRKAAEQQAAMDERMRLARDLHDSATQTVTAIGMNARTLSKVWAADPVQGRRQLEELVTLAAAAQAELRTLLLEMRPAELTRVPLPALLEQLAASAQGRSSAAVELTADALSFLPPDVKVAFYRVAQEALNNLVKHARAQSVQVRLQERAGTAILAVIDDGMGFDPDAVPGGHLGMRGMQERARSVDAELAVHSAPGQGTQIVLVWPAPQASLRRTAGGWQP